jgi:hypothetical protein
MPSKLSKTIESLRTMLPRCGFEADSYGHFQKEAEGRTHSGEVVPAKMRIKIQDKSVRIELKRATPGSEWNKIDGAYLKDVVISEYSVTIGRRQFKVMF